MLKKHLVYIIVSLISLISFSQTTLTEAENFHVKTIEGDPIWLFPLLDDENQIVVIDFFSTSCGPCQDYADDFQACYENFGLNQGNVFFMGINWGNDNQGVHEFDSIFGLTYPSVSGSQGGGNIVYQDYNILSYPTVIVITPDHNIVEQYVWPPDEETITAAVIAAGGIVGNKEITSNYPVLKFFPNPVKTTGTLEITLRESKSITVTISNSQGIEVIKFSEIEMHSGTNKMVIDVSSINRGYYLLLVKTADGTTLAHKLTVI